MKNLALFIALMITISLEAQLTINDPNVESRNLKNFHAISVSSSFDVYISQGNEEAVAVSVAEEKYKGNIKTEVKDGVLRIWFEKEGKFWKGWNDKLKLKAYISFKNIDRLTASGACDVHLQGTIKADDLSVNLSGASDIKEGIIKASKMKVELNGASDMKISGSAAELDIQASGASDFKGFDFEAEVCDAHASGASNINITVNKELSAHASGASDVNYKGNGLIRDLKTSGASSVSRRS